MANAKECLDKAGLEHLWGLMKQKFAASIESDGENITLKSADGSTLASAAVSSGGGWIDYVPKTAKEQIDVLTVHKHSGDTGVFAGPKLVFKWYSRDGENGADVAHTITIQGNKVNFSSLLQVTAGNTLTAGTINATMGITSSGSVTPNSTDSYNLGSSSRRWNAVYAKTGSIQTSDRAAKDDIHYIEADESAPSPLGDSPMESPGAEETAAGSAETVNLSDVLNFVRALKPATFCYRGADGESVTVDGAPPEAVQLGVIADDIADSPLFKYVGCKMEDDGAVSLGVKPVPLAVAALTACKYLLEKVEALESAVKGCGSPL